LGTRQGDLGLLFRFSTSTARTTPALLLGRFGGSGALLRSVGFRGALWLFFRDFKSGKVAFPGERHFSRQDHLALSVQIG
jgi:hypothetical protein